MMIIKEPELKVYKKTCDRCGCEFEYNVKDLSYVEKYDYRFNSFYRKRDIVCPFCQKRHDIEKEVAEEYYDLFER